MTGRTPPPPPHNLDAERSIIGNVIMTQAVGRLEQYAIEPRHFYDPRHRALWEVILSLHRAGRATDAISIEYALGEHKRLVGGIEGIAKTLDVIEKAVFMPEHARILKDCWRRREAIKIARKLESEAYENELDGDGLVSMAQTELAHLALDGESEVLTAEELALDTMDELNRELSGDNPRISTGIKRLDRMTGQFMPGQVCVIGARPGMGKSTMGQKLCKEAAEDGVPCYVAQLEMTKYQVGKREAIARGGLYYSDIRQGMPVHAITAFSRNMQEFARLPIVTRFKRVDVVELESDVKRWRSSPSVKDSRRAMVVVDYVQLVRSQPSRTFRNREQEIAEISARMKDLAKVCKCVVILLAQLNRDVDKRDNGRPRLSDLRESGALEQDADQVWLLYRPIKAFEGVAKEDSEVVLAKLREGNEGICPVKYDPARLTFCDATDQEIEYWLELRKKVAAEKQQAKRGRDR